MAKEMAKSKAVKHSLAMAPPISDDMGMESMAMQMPAMGMP